MLNRLAIPAIVYRIVADAPLLSHPRDLREWNGFQARIINAIADAHAIGADRLPDLAIAVGAAYAEVAVRPDPIGRG